MGLNGWNDEGTMNQIRAVALCVFLNNNRILVFEGHDPIKDETYYRPLGGGIEFGENGEAAVRREIMEELHSGIADLTHMGFLENIFMYNGKFREKMANRTPIKSKQ